jgi:ribosome maturation factor RimP
MKEKDVKKMEKKYMERLIGKYCKIVTKEPGEERASVVTGTLEEVDYQDGFILVDSEQGLGCLRINTIIAIKPARKYKYIEENRKIRE